MKEKETKLKKEKKKNYSATLRPSMTLKVEKLAERNQHSFSKQLDLIIEEYFEFPEVKARARSRKPKED